RHLVRWGGTTANDRRLAQRRDATPQTVDLAAVRIRAAERCQDDVVACRLIVRGHHVFTKEHRAARASAHKYRRNFMLHGSFPFYSLSPTPHPNAFPLWGPWHRDLLLQTCFASGPRQRDGERGSLPLSTLHRKLPSVRCDDFLHNV